MSEKSSKCRFCSILNKEYLYDEIDFPIFENDKYFALSSIGAFIEGWILVIPKSRVYSMKSFFKNSSFYEFVNIIAGRLNKKYNEKIILFEHGANKCNSQTACGTNHAHIHLVPYKDSLQKIIQNKKKGWKKIKFSEVETYVGDSEYLLYSDLDDFLTSQTFCFVHKLKEPYSQFFREILAEEIGKKEEYNYKIYKNLKNAKLTYLKMKD